MAAAHAPKGTAFSPITRNALSWSVTTSMIAQTMRLPRRPITAKITSAMATATITISDMTNHPGESEPSCSPSSFIRQSSHSYAGICSVSISITDWSSLGVGRRSQTAFQTSA